MEILFSPQVDNALEVAYRACLLLGIEIGKASPGANRTKKSMHFAQSLVPKEASTQDARGSQFFARTRKPEWDLIFHNLTHFKGLRSKNLYHVKKSLSSRRRLEPLHCSTRKMPRDGLHVRAIPRGRTCRIMSLNCNFDVYSYSCIDVQSY